MSLENLLEIEVISELDKLHPYFSFSERVHNLKDLLVTFVSDAKKDGKRIYALGASTKGNVILQFCNLDSEMIEFVGEVNKNKFNCFTPGTLIPIIPEDELLHKNPDYILILPWHFYNTFANEKKFKRFNLLFPMPELLILKGNQH